jgi:hypothetical protein
MKLFSMDKIETAMTEKQLRQDLPREVMVALRGVHKWFGDLHVLKGIDLAQDGMTMICITMRWSLPGLWPIGSLYGWG